MSFSFRNIFSSDDPDFNPDNNGESTEEPLVPSMRSNLFSTPQIKGPTRSFLVGELLPFIPKAIAAQSGIPMEKEVAIPLPEDGSLDVKLSTIFGVCPELFAAEITPLNDTSVTLPPRLGAAETPPAKKPSKPSFSSEFASDSSATGSSFWSPVASDSSAEKGEKEKGGKIGGFSDPSAPVSSTPFSQSPPATSGAVDSPFQSSPQSPSHGSLSSFTPSGFSTSFPPAQNQSTPKAKGDEPLGFSTVFSQHAKEDREIPVPDFSGFADAPVAENSPAGDEPPGIWGAMFSEGAFVGGDADHDNDAADAPYDSIGNLLKQTSSALKGDAGKAASGDSATAEASPFSSFTFPSSPKPPIAEASPAADPLAGMPSGFTAPPVAPEAVEAVQSASVEIEESAPAISLTPSTKSPETVEKAPENPFWSVGASSPVTESAPGEKVASQDEVQIPSEFPKSWSEGEGNPFHAAPDSTRIADSGFAPAGNVFGAAPSQESAPTEETASAEGMVFAGFSSPSTADHNGASESPSGEVVPPPLPSMATEPPAPSSGFGALSVAPAEESTNPFQSFQGPPVLPPMDAMETKKPEPAFTSLAAELPTTLTALTAPAALDQPVVEAPVEALVPATDFVAPAPVSEEPSLPNAFEVPSAIMDEAADPLPAPAAVEPVVEAPSAPESESVAPPSRESSTQEPVAPEHLAPSLVQIKPVASIVSEAPAMPRPQVESMETIDSVDAVDSAEIPAPSISKSRSSAPEKDLEPDDMRDLELRAIFSTSERFTLAKVARKVVGLPGIESCTLSIPGRFVQASRREESRSGKEAREMVSALYQVARLTGFQDARSFTIQTDKGVMTIFLEGDAYVTIQHESAKFAPGIREKLILVSRCIERLRE